MEALSRVGLVKTFFNEGSSRPVEIKEMMAFWASCSPAEKQEFSDSASRQLGIPVKADA